jgi:hypothetical protein
MNRKFQALLRYVLAVFAGVAVVALASAAQAEDQPKLTAISVQVTTSDKGVVYQSYANRYVVGPNGWIEWKITVKEKLAGFTEGASYSFDTEGVSYHDRKRAVTKRHEGDHAIVLRFEPGHSNASGTLTFDRRMKLDNGVTRYYASAGGETKIESTSVIDMSGIAGMPVAQFKREYPTLTITPNPDDLRRSGPSQNGLTVDRIIVDVNDPLLDPQDFEFKYRLIAGTYNKSADWTTMAERNFIPVPPEARYKGANLAIEVRDRGGNWRPYTYNYDGPGWLPTSRVAMNSFDIIGGGDAGGQYLRLLGASDFPQEARAEMLREAKEDFKYLRTTYESPKNAYAWLAVFLYSMGHKVAAGYTGYADIDLTKSGYLWSASDRLPEDDLPVTPFSETYRAVEINPLNGRQYEGHWAYLSSADTAALGDGTYYLYIKSVDAVTGGFMWQQVYYDADRALVDKNATNFAPVKLIKDRTPPTIDFEDQPFIRGDYVIDAAVSDNAGLGAAQVMVSEFDFCARSPGACESLGDAWTDAPLNPDGKTASIAVDTAPLMLDRTHGVRLYVYVRAVEQRHKVGAYENDPFAAGNKANIVTAGKEYFILRGDDTLVLKAAYVDKVDDQGRLASAPEHRVRLYPHAAGFLAAEGDVRYRIEAASGTVVQDWTTVPGGQELALAGADGEYVLRAVALDAEGVQGSVEYALRYVIGPAASAPMPTATFGTTEMTNQDITLTLTSAAPIKILNWAGIDPSVASTTHTLVLNDSNPFDAPRTIQYEPDGGAAESMQVSVGQIDKSGFQHLLGGGYIVYTPKGATVEPVTAHIYVGKRVKPGSGDGITYRNGWLSFSFPANGEHVFEAEDAAGSALRAYVNDDGRKAVVTWIDSSAPPIAVAYSTTAATNQPVTATLQLPGGYTVINNAGSASYKFFENGEFDFLVKDGNGVVREYKAAVANIDKEAPVLTLDGPLMYPVYQGLPFVLDESGYTAVDNRDGDVSANVQVTSNVDVYKGGYYEIVYTVTDSAGNIARKTRAVSVMDMNGINLFANGIRLRGDVAMPRGTLRFDIAGQESDELVFLYLPGKHAAGAFKGGGTPIADRTLTLNEAGWYTFFVQDRERRTFVGQIHVQ